MILTPIPRDKLAHTLDRFMAGLHDRFSRAVFRQIRATFAGTRRRSGGVASRRSPSPAPSACRSTPREPRAASIGDGTALNGATEAYVILHEVAHFALAPPERRELVEFGPGASPDTLDCSAAERTTVLSLERDADEAAASLLGIVCGWAREPALTSFLDQNWLEGLDRSAVGHFTAVVKTLRHRDLLNVVRAPVAATAPTGGRAPHCWSRWPSPLIGAEKVDLAMAEPQCVGLELGVTLLHGSAGWTQ